MFFSLVASGQCIAELAAVENSLVDLADGECIAGLPHAGMLCQKLLIQRIIRAHSQRHDDHICGKLGNMAVLGALGDDLTICIFYDFIVIEELDALVIACLLYTSDAADE